ncbi:MAG: EamA family transporter [Sulfitobacter sp.]
MLSLSLGLCAALAWGIHDICVRYVSQRGGILPALTTVLVLGSIVLIPVTLAFGGWQDMTRRAYGFSVLGGFCYIFGCVGLYKSFGIGPVKLVAPIVGAYPILSIGWSAVQGQAISLDQWLAVGMVVSGIALVSLLSDQKDSSGSQKEAIGWAIMAAIGFACTFAVGHIATQAGAELPVILTTRIVTATGVGLLLLYRSGLTFPERSAWPMLTVMATLDAFALGIVIASGGLDRPEFAAVAASVFGIVTIILAWAFLKEHMAPAQWGGVILTFAGIGYLAV